MSRHLLEHREGALLERCRAFVLPEVRVQGSKVAEAQRELRVRRAVLLLEDGARFLLWIDRVARLALTRKHAREPVERRGGKAMRRAEAKLHERELLP